VLVHYAHKPEDFSGGGGGGGEDLVVLRWRVVMDCWEAMGQCRKKDQWNHRSVYRKAVALRYIIISIIMIIIMLLLLLYV